MPYLAIDTATQALTVAVGEPDLLLAEASVVVKKNHSNRLMPLIESLLASLDLQPDELKGIVVGHGPGSYTGVRIGVTTGKMMAWTLKVPLVGVSSLNGLARHFAALDALVCPMFDARRKQVYCSLYDRQPGDGRFIKLEPDALRKLEHLFQVVEQRLTHREMEGRPRRVLFAGDGAENYRELIQDRFGDGAMFPVSSDQKLVRAAYLLEEGIARIVAGETVEAETFVPEYLQLVEAEAKLLARQGQACGEEGA
ncbi:tRNA (adenosine(37)-N6)-threonylcarbamoyltransferase complex dimerization subunit type 1 TsaB [Effusibacillus lacus]|uniref:tRNA threonylcarbamoyladenosine biosynthesis protein TsaB n=1 Tax=Effusibacillus lacus TaxID=1348429 RepID=A0A292YI80_9BACL|nr:tRNA (adenosine(37)-N6)-threonylcarbamoyltransferase complex dimerization subunit type 1 TsaB [Effusibacillus lacus]TCS74339.1 tRNA threonylcarbamoyladenosine biosynthesis protein TsaB [Effusibacillus lacus]GAX88796.1 tRNA threonylcarbamoyladenosine biosynthesis protein TsaB [Effusibacillus lacus]